MRRIGLFCGTFNPIHFGHLLIAENAREQFALEKVIFVTSPKPPHRNTDLLTAEERHELVAAAVAGNKFFEASRMEFEREGPSYTVDTVRQLKRECPEVEFDLIVGGDNIKSLNKWKDVDELLASCRLLVAPRIIYDGPVLETVGRASLSDERFDMPGARIEFIQFPVVAISSSSIRERLKTGRSIRYMVPGAVNEILLARRHYTQ